MNPQHKIHSILHAALLRDESSNVKAFTVHENGYAEPGYNNPESGIIVTGNFNNDSTYIREQGKRIDVSTLPSRLAHIFEARYGAEIEWSDEWVDCDDCGKLFRCSGDSYGWTQYGIIDNGSCLCGDCIKQDPTDYLKNLEGEPNKAVTISGIDPEKHGYVQIIGDLENGWYGGQDDDPRSVAKSLREKGVNRFIFVIDQVGQFDLKFSVYVHEDEAKIAQDGPVDTKADEDPAAVLKRGLQAATLQQGHLTARASATPKSTLTGPPRPGSSPTRISSTESGSNHHP